MRLFGLADHYAAGVIELPPTVGLLGNRLADLRWVLHLFVAGSLATGDYIAGVSDVDMVAVTDGPVDGCREYALTALHQELDEGPARGLDLGCVYVDMSRLLDEDTMHPTWTHGALIQRTLSGVTRAELVRHGLTILGRPPCTLLPEMTDDDVRKAARTEICGYWNWAARRPRMWLNPVIADLGLTSMARGRYAVRTGQLLSKTQAIEQAHAPTWLIDQLAARRRGEQVVSPRVNTARIAWRDARTTVAEIGCGKPTWRP